MTAKLKKGENGDWLWNARQSEFQGYTRASLEDIKDQIKEIKTVHAACRIELLEKTDKNKKEIGNMKMTSALFGGIAGAVGGFLRGFL